MEPQVIPILCSPDPSLFRPSDPDRMTAAGGAMHQRGLVVGLLEIVYEFMSTVLAETCGVIVSSRSIDK